MSLRILLADDQKSMRQSLQQLIEKESDMKVVAEADNGLSTVQLAKKVIPDLIIMDVVMPDMNGIEATKQILSLNPDMKILAVSMYSDKRFVEGMINAGAMGYIIKEDAFNELAIAIRNVLENKFYLSEQLVQNLEDENTR